MKGSRDRLMRERQLTEELCRLYHGIDCGLGCGPTREPEVIELPLVPFTPEQWSDDVDEMFDDDCDLDEPAHPAMTCSCDDTVFDGDFAELDTLEFITPAWRGEFPCR